MERQSAIQAQFLRNAEGNPMILFFKDPEFVRAETIIFDRKDNSLHAVMFEQAHFIGHLDKNEVAAMDGLSEILLTSSHYKNGVVNLHASVRVSQ